jgi:hypothetical protein
MPIAFGVLRAGGVIRDGFAIHHLRFAICNCPLGIGYSHPEL